jgi:hypothetical protein
MHMAPQAPGQPPLSPPAEASTTLAGKSVTVKYSAPSMRGRKIMGELVPYGKWWRTGANSATTLVTEGNIVLGDLHLPAGTYTLYTLPAAHPQPWLLIVNKQTGQWGTVYDEKKDLGRTQMHYDKMSAPQEVMSISFEHANGRSAELHVRWENTDVFVPVVAD